MDKALTLMSLVLLVGCVSGGDGFELGRQAPPVQLQVVETATASGSLLPAETGTSPIASPLPDAADGSVDVIAGMGVPTAAPRGNNTQTAVLAIAETNEDTSASQQIIENATSPSSASLSQNEASISNTSAEPKPVTLGERLANLFSSSRKSSNSVSERKTTRPANSRSDDENPQFIAVRRIRPTQGTLTTTNARGNIASQQNNGAPKPQAGLPGVKSNSEIFGIENENNSLGVNDNSATQLASAAGIGLLSPNGLRVQHDKVKVACLKPGVLQILKIVERHYGKKPIITSGYRSPKRNRRAGGARNSQHIFCKAVDIQVEGVSKWDLAKYLRTIPGRGGVGTYCRTKSVHIDIGSKRDWHHSCRRSSKRKKRA